MTTSEMKEIVDNAITAERPLILIFKTGETVPFQPTSCEYVFVRSEGDGVHLCFGFALDSTTPHGTAYALETLEEVRTVSGPE